MNYACELLRELAASMLRADFEVPVTPPGLRKISLTRYPVIREPYLLDCQFESGSAPTLAELTAAFGDASELPTDRGRPRALQLGELARDERAAVLLVAQLPLGMAPDGDLRVDSLTLRRDPA